MNILEYRVTYKPFEYPEARVFWEKQENAHWLPSEISMEKDVQDWKYELTDSERQVLGQILKSFTQTELHVNEYWSSNVTKWFPKHEIRMMCSAFANMESIHTEGYDYLNSTLGLDDYSAFLEDETAVAKLDNLKIVDNQDDLPQIARSLAIFSAFTEGVNLFSSFAILTGLSRYGLLNGVKNIVNYSRLDENLHSEAGCWLFRTLISENPQIWTDELKKDIYEAARISVKLEDDFIDKCFSLGNIRGLDPKDLKVYIRHRANSKLRELGLKSNWKNLDQEALKRMDWFDLMSNGISNTDFFSHKVTEYAKSNFNSENLFKE